MSTDKKGYKYGSNPPKKGGKTRGLFNQNTRKQLDALGIDVGPSPAQRVEQDKKKKKK